MVQNVSFKYNDKSPYIYKNLEFGIDLDTRLALVKRFFLSFIVLIKHIVQLLLLQFHTLFWGDRISYGLCKAFISCYLQLIVFINGSHNCFTLYIVQIFCSCFISSSWYFICIFKTIFTLSKVGPNGAGKSTLLKLLFGELVPTSGMIRKNSHLRIARYHQHLHELLDLDLSPIDYIMKQFPELKERDEVRCICTCRNPQC